MPMTPDYLKMALEWFQTVAFNAYYASAVKIPYVVGESTGIILFLSTAESSRVYAENMASIESGQVITKPFWFYFQVYQYQNMALLNLGSFCDNRYQGHMPAQNVESFFDTIVCLNNPNWKTQYRFNVGGEYLFDSLRKAIVEYMRCNVWVELTAGRSWRAYGGLDMYVRIMTTAMRPPKEEAWYILNCSQPFWMRDRPAPEDWWRYQDYRAFGQREIINDFFVDVFAGVLVRRRTNHQIDMPPGIFATLPVFMQEAITRRNLARPRL